MALPTTGEINMQQIATEFRKSASNIKLSDYYKQISGSQPLDTTMNLNIPYGPAYSGNEIKMSDFYGSGWYTGTVTFTVVGERTTTYADGNDGYMYWAFANCTSPTIQIQIGNYTKTFYGQSYAEDLYIKIGDCQPCTQVLYFTDARGTYTISCTGRYGRGSETKTIDLANSVPNSYTRRL